MADFGDTGREVASKIERTAERLQQRSTITGHAADKLHDVADKVGSISVEDYHARVKDMVDSAKCEVDKNVKHVETSIKDHPFESIAIAAGAGILAGAIIAYMGRSRRYVETR